MCHVHHVCVCASCKIAQAQNDMENVNAEAYAASIKLAVQRLDLYFEDADSAAKICKEKSGRKKKAGPGDHSSMLD